MFPLENYRCLKCNRSKAGLIIFLGTGLTPPVCALSHGHHQLESSPACLWPSSLHPTGHNIWTKTHNQMIALDAHETDQSIKFYWQFKEQTGWHETKSGLGHLKWLLHSFLPSHTEQSLSGPEWSLRNLSEVLWGSPQKQGQINLPYFIYSEKWIAHLVSSGDLCLYRLFHFLYRLCTYSL